MRERRWLAALGACAGLAVTAPALAAILAAKEIIDLRRETGEAALPELSAGTLLAMLVQALAFAGVLLTLIGYARTRHQRYQAEAGEEP